MELSEKTRRIETVDIAKGIGIILVVWAHAAGPLSHYINLFHMPFFFLLSGYLYNIGKDTGLTLFVKRKAFRLYIPFLLCNIPAMLFGWAVLHRLSFAKTMKRMAGTVLTVSNDAEFFGATWFLGSLFVISCLYKYVDSKTSLKRELILLLSALGACVGFLVDIPFGISKNLILGFFYSGGGIIYHYKAQLSRFDNALAAIVAGIFFFVSGKYNRADMGSNTYKSASLFILGALCASYAVIYFSRVMSKYCPLHIKSIFIALGKHSIDVVIWQFIAFKLVIAIQLVIKGIPLNNILDYFPCYSTDGMWWVIYLLVGLYGSRLIGILLHKFSVFDYAGRFVFEFKRKFSSHTRTS